MGGARSWRNARIYTVGHSTRPIDELVAMLRAFDISVLADIRTIPRSRHNPQFDGDALRSALHSRRIRYVHVPELGGLRRARKDSPNTAWRNASFRGYADHMLTEDFELGLAKLRVLVSEGTVALMCAEAVPWRCHRSLVADALLARGARVEHITGSTGRASPHRMTSFAEIDGTRVTYPGDAGGRLATRAPFHLEATVRVLQRRPANLVDVWNEDKYLRVLAMGDGLTLVEVCNRGTIDRPDVRFTVLRGESSAADSTTLDATLRRVLGLDVDPEPLGRALEAEARLAPTALALRGMRPPRFAGLFDAFANVVPFQQLSLDALLCELPGIGPWSAALVLLRGFGRLDVFPPGDVGAARGLSTLMRLQQGPSLDRIVERFGDRRGYLYFCSLGAALLNRGLIVAAPTSKRRPKPR